MKAWGVQRLFMLPDTEGFSKRWCFARVNNINVSNNADSFTNYLQPITMNFQVSDPFWYDSGNEKCWNEFNWNDGSVYNNQTLISVTSHPYTTTINYNGSANTFIRLTAKVSSSAISGLTIRRLYNGIVKDEFSYLKTLNANDVLSIEPRQQRCYVNYVKTSDFYNKTKEWLQLEKGVNTIKILSDGNYSLSLNYFNRYY